MTRGGAYYVPHTASRNRMGMRSKQYRESELELFRRNPTYRAVYREPSIRRMAFVEGVGWVACGSVRQHMQTAYARRHRKITNRAWTVICPLAGRYNGKMWHSIVYAKVDLELAQMYYAHYLMTEEGQ